ncbi:sodium:calcium antiporter [Myceligenerans pegani]|uniref:Cation transporter n=1 Tax=Myceligenerans pegani TaxID=2776917 RepID=A0ABR9MRW0_9MICO|nr:cation transporter [Myceligenerans sp. TRM 65318]MBE1874122.1 cation transporter [Myceligenerans sp. TRM 65318]MBE3016394.1 cation transporter [Myceligenerans sp. TRM 65318]
MTPLLLATLVFAGAALVTVWGSIRLAGLGDVLADRTGWGEAIFGAVFFGVFTSLSGIVMTALSAADGYPELAYANAVGGVAAQTFAIAVADLFYRRSNLEHAAASLPNVLFGCLLMAMLTVTLMGSFTPETVLGPVHPTTLVLVVLYGTGLVLIRRSAAQPMWRAVRTESTRQDVVDENAAPARRLRGLWIEFAAVALLVSAGGAAIARSAQQIVGGTGLSAGFVGAVLMGVVNALPETVTAVAAVRRGALTLAIAAILGGNTLDVLNVAIGDVFYVGGSIYHAPGPDSLFLTAASILMTIVVVAGLLVRQDRGPARVGFEGIGLALAYGTTVLVLAF